VLALVATVETCGAVGYTPKPFDVDHVLAVVARHVGSR